MTHVAPPPDRQQADKQSEASGPAPRLTATELRRRFWHMAPGLLPVLLWNFPHRDPLSPTLYAIMLALIAALALGIFAGYRLISRSGESNQRLAAVGGYAGSVLLTLIAFPAHAELGLTVLAVLAFGDGSATLGGLLLGGPRLPWNRGKTLSGLLCFLLAGGAWAALIYWGETTQNPEAVPPIATLRAALFCGFSAALTAGLAESIPSRLNDNIRVGLTAALTLVVTHGLVVGWWSAGFDSWSVVRCPSDDCGGRSTEVRQVTGDPRTPSSPPPRHSRRGGRSMRESVACLGGLCSNSTW